MPTPWPHPKYRTYYLKKRVPTDIKHLWQGVDPVQVSLGTKDESEAHTRISREWLKLQDKFNELRRLAARQVGLCEEIIPDLLDEWFHDNLKEDEIWRFDGTIAKADGDKSGGYSELIDQLAEGADSGNHPYFLIRSAAFFLSKKGTHGERPHKLAFAAYSFAYTINKLDRNSQTRATLQIPFGKLMLELLRNGKAYELDAVGDRLGRDHRDRRRTSHRTE